MTLKVLLRAHFGTLKQEQCPSFRRPSAIETCWTKRDAGFDMAWIGRSIFPMDESKLETILKHAVANLFDHQPNIFEFTPQTGQTEWNLAYHLAVELSALLPDLHCDIDVLKRGYGYGNRRPDIIFHERRTHRSNFLVIEMKRDVWCSPSFGPKFSLLKVARCLQYIIASHFMVRRLSHAISGCPLSAYVGSGGLLCAFLVGDGNVALSYLRNIRIGLRSVHGSKGRIAEQ
jgi:hypothetical protein